MGYMSFFFCILNGFRIKKGEIKKSIILFTEKQ